MADKQHEWYRMQTNYYDIMKLNLKNIWLKGKIHENSNS